MLGFTASTNAILRHVYTALGTSAALLVYLGLSPDDIQKVVAAVHQVGDGFAQILGGLGVLVPIVCATYARWTAKPAQQQAAVEKTGAIVVPPSEATKAAATTLSSHWLVGAIAVLLLLVVGACTVTGSDGVAVTVTPANFVDVVSAKVKAECPVVKAIASTAVLVTPVVADLANQAAAGNTAVQVEQAAADACSKLTAATTATPAPASSGTVPLPASSAGSGGVVTLPATTVTAPAPTPAVPLAASSGG
jgi:hypothetical protein